MNYHAWHRRAQEPQDADVAPPGVRHAWMDAGRGLAIVLVVSLHSSDWLSKAGLNVDVWEHVDNLLAGLRMPLFFAISGMLGSKWLTSSWPRLVARKVTSLLWVYLLWQPIGLLASVLAYRITAGHTTASHLLIALIVTPLRPRSELWFLWALAAYFLLARAGRRIPAPVQLMVAGVVSAVWLSGLVPDGNLGWNGVPKYFVFFLLGCHYRRPIQALVDRPRRSAGLGGALIAVWALAAIIADRSGVERFPGPGLFLGLVGLAAGLALAVFLARWPLIRHLGSRTLPIYLAHTPIIIVLTWLVHLNQRAVWVQDLVPVLPVVLTVGVIALALALHAAITSTPARLLYAPPARLTSLVLSILSGPPRSRADLPPDAHLPPPRDGNPAPAWHEVHSDRLADPA